MRKAIHLTSVHPRDDIRIYFKQCISLEEAGYEVNLIVADGKGNDFKNIINIFDVGKPSCSRLFRMTMTTFKILLLAMKMDGDVYHFHDPELMLAGLALKLKGKKVLYDVHEDLPRQVLSKVWIKPLFRRMVSMLVEKFENFSASCFDGVVCATPHILRRFESINEKSINVNNFPRVEEISLAPSWGQRENEICYIGGISENRGIRELVSVMENVDAPLNLLGQFQNISLREELISKPGWAKVREYGQVSRDVVVQVLSLSKVGIVILKPISNYIDSLPIKMFEYMLAGVPVVASNFPVWESIISEHECGICIDPQDISGISHAINLLLEDQNKAKKMGENGRNAVIEKFNWKCESAKLVELYKSVI